MISRAGKESLITVILVLLSAYLTFATVIAFLINGISDSGNPPSKTAVILEDCLILALALISWYFTIRNLRSAHRKKPKP